MGQRATLGGGLSPLPLGQQCLTYPQTPTLTRPQRAPSQRSPQFPSRPTPAAPPASGWPSLTCYA